MSACEMALRQRAAACAAAIALCVCARGQAQESPQPEPAPPVRQVEPLQPWELLGSNLGRIYGWPNIMWSVSAVAVTPPLVAWADEPVQEFFQDEDPLTNTFGDVTLIVGYGMPIVAPLTVYLVG